MAWAIRSQRRLGEEGHLNLAYRWFCRLGPEGDVPDHSTFSKNRHGQFRDSDLLRAVFEMTVRRCSEEKRVGGEGFALDASLIRADGHRKRAMSGADLAASQKAARAASGRARGRGLRARRRSCQSMGRPPIRLLHRRLARTRLPFAQFIPTGSGSPNGKGAA
jgi:hypothetical protein